MTITISAAIVAQNENGPLFRACIDSALNMLGAKEVIIVDGGSTDHTPEKIWDWFPNESHIEQKIKIYHRPFRNAKSYTQNRNYAINQCTGKWILNLDADEVLDDSSLLIQQQLQEKGTTTEIWDIQGVHYLYNLNTIDATLDTHRFLGRLFTNKEYHRYPSHTMHGVVPGSGTNLLPGTYIHHFGYMKGLLNYMLNKWNQNSKNWEIHKPDQFRQYIQHVLTGTYPTKQRDVDLPSSLKLNRFLI